MKALPVLLALLGGSALYASNTISSPAPAPALDECVCKTITGGALLDTDCYRIVLADTEVTCDGSTPVSVNFGGVSVTRVGTSSDCKEIGDVIVYSGEDKNCNGGLDGPGDMKDGMLNTMPGGEETSDFTTTVNGNSANVALGTVQTGGATSVKFITYLSVTDIMGKEIFNKKISRTASN